MYFHYKYLKFWKVIHCMTFDKIAFPIYFSFPASLNSLSIFLKFLFANDLIAGFPQFLVSTLSKI